MDILYKIILAILLFQITNVEAQNKLTGIVVDETSQCLPGVSVLLYTSNDTVNYLQATQTTKAGLFTFEKINSGEYIIKLSNVGMEAKTISAFVSSHNMDLENGSVNQASVIDDLHCL